MDLKNKTALITGASSGIGKSFADLLAQRGANVILVARSAEKLEVICRDLTKKYNIHASFYAQDLGKIGAAQHLYDTIRREGKTVDLLINNAGFGKWGKFEEFSLETYRSMVQLNITTLMELCYLFLEDLKQRPEAGIINVGSTASFIPVPYSAVYAATKSFVLNFTEGLVGELDGTTVRVSCLCPAGTSTNFAAVADDQKRADNSKEKMKSPDQVAKEGLNAFLKQKHYVVTGRKFQLLLLKFFSRSRVIRMVADSWKKRMGIA